MKNDGYVSGYVCHTVHILAWTDMSTNKVLQMVWDREYWRDIVHRAAKVRNDE